MRLESCQNRFKTEIEILDIELRQVVQSHSFEIETRVDIEFESVVHFVGERKRQSQSLEQIAHAERVFYGCETEFLVCRGYEDLRKHHLGNAFKSLHSEDYVEKFVKREAFAYITSVVVLYESVVVRIERVSFGRIDSVQCSFIVHVGVRCTAVVVDDEAQIHRNDVCVGELFKSTAVYDCVDLGVYRLASLRVVARCQCNVFDADTDVDEVAVDVEVESEAGIELEINRNGQVEIKLFEDLCDVDVAARAGRNRRNKPDDDVFHNENAEFTFRDAQNELHLFVCAKFSGICRRGSVVSALAYNAVEVAEQFLNVVANDFAEVGIFEIERFVSAEFTEVEVYISAVDVHGKNAFSVIFVFDFDNHSRRVCFVKNEVCTNRQTYLVRYVVLEVDAEFKTEILDKKVKVFFKTDFLVLLFETEFETEFDVERESIEVFKTRVYGRVEIFGQNTVVFADFDINSAERDTERKRVCLDFEVKFIVALPRRVVVPHKREITVVGVEFEEVVRGNLFAGYHTDERCYERLCKVDFYFVLADTDTADEVAEG